MISELFVEIRYERRVHSLPCSVGKYGGGFGRPTGRLQNLKSQRASEPEAPQCAPFRIESTGFQSTFDGGISRMHFRADAPNTSLAGIFKKSSNEASTNTFASPLRRDE